MPNDQSWNTVAASPAERVAQDITLTATYRDLPTPEIEQVADSSTSITIGLTTPSDSDALYRLECSVDGGAYEFVADLLEADFPYERAGLPAGSYKHQVFARNPYMDTPLFEVASAVTLEGEIIPDPEPGQQVISGTGFGEGPNVVLFDSFSSGTHGEIIDYVNGPEIGSWDGDINSKSWGAVADTEYYEYGGRNWMSGRRIASINTESDARTGLTWLAANEFTEFRIAFRRLIPPGFKMPGASEPNSNDNFENTNNSNWKVTWFGHPDYGWGAAGHPDLCLPTLKGRRNWENQGNSIKWLDYQNDSGGSVVKAVGGFSAVNENLDSFYQKPATVTGTHTGTVSSKDGIIEALGCRGAGTTIEKSSQADPWYNWNGSPEVMAFKSILFNGWSGNIDVSMVGVLPLYGDIYLAVGANSRACIMTSDSANLAESTKTYIVPPDEGLWTDTEIRYTPRPWENLPYRHLILADGTLLENV